MLVPLHGVLASKDQRRAFDPAPAGSRKVVLSTNIAETGVTIGDVVFVIDAGFENSMRYDAGSRMSALKTVRISKASATQRAGRAGRVSPGFAFRLFTKKDFGEMEEQARPEMQRLPLESVCLQILDTSSWHPHALFARCISPPAPRSVDAALAVLHEAGALQKAGGGEIDNAAFESGVFELSPLGRVMAQLPLEPFVARMLIFSGILRCLSPLSVVAAATMSQT